MKKYYSDQTELALKNFSFPVRTVAIELIYAMTQIKKAAALAHKSASELPEDIADAIIQACDEILSGKFDDQFVTCAVQGGAGTSIHMNVNEVIASRAEEICNKEVHPNDDVNMGQSTNDVGPSSLKITAIKLTETLLRSLDHLNNELTEKANEWRTIKKIGRTHIQDAVPTTLGAEFQAYADIVKRDKKRIEEVIPYLYDLNLGGTAIGNKINASEKYIEEVYKELKKITGLPIKEATNLMVGTQNAADFCHLSSVVNILFCDLNKIATDIRILSSGPYGGFGEITMKKLQNGSSIMPGKVNPIIPESINQIAFSINGKNLTIHQAATNANLELALMFPVLADSLISMLKVAASGVFVLGRHCIQTIIANPEKCNEHLERSTVFATLLVPELGYDTVAQAVKEAVESNKPLRQIIVGKKLLTDTEFDAIINKQIIK